MLLHPEKNVIKRNLKDKDMKIKIQDMTRNKKVVAAVVEKKNLKNQDTKSKDLIKQIHQDILNKNLIDEMMMKIIMALQDLNPEMIPSQNPNQEKTMSQRILKDKRRMLLMKNYIHPGKPREKRE